MWPRLAAIALAVQAGLLTNMQLPLTTLKDGPHVSSLARTGCSSHLKSYFGPNASAVFLPICSLAEPQRLLQRLEIEKMSTREMVFEAQCLAEEDTIPEPPQDLTQPIWWTMYGSMTAVTGLTAAPALLTLSKVPRTLCDFLLRATVFLFIASFVANYFSLGTELDLASFVANYFSISLEVNLERVRLLSTVALIVMGIASSLQQVASVLFPICLLGWPVGLVMAARGVLLAAQPLAPALVAAVTIAWLTVVGFYFRSRGGKLEKRSQLRNDRLAKEPSNITSNITKRSRSATPPPKVGSRSSAAGGA